MFFVSFVFTYYGPAGISLAGLPYKTLKRKSTTRFDAAAVHAINTACLWIAKVSNIFACYRWEPTLAVRAVPPGLLLLHITEVEWGTVERITSTNLCMLQK